MTGTAQPPPYQQGTEPEFARRAAATFVLEDFGSALVLSGPCPRCGQEMDFTLVAELFRNTTGDDPAPGRPVTMFCTAEAAYDGAPEGGSGCGAYWSLLLPAGATGTGGASGSGETGGASGSGETGGASGVNGAGG